MPNKLTPEQFYKDNFKQVVIDHLVVSGILRAEHEKNAYLALRDLLSWEHVLSTDPRVCEEASNLLWSAPEGWSLEPKVKDALDTNVPIECIMQEDQSCEYDWVYESNLWRAGL